MLLFFLFVILGIISNHKTENKTQIRQYEQSQPISKKKTLPTKELTQWDKTIGNQAYTDNKLWNKLDTYVQAMKICTLYTEDEKLQFQISIGVVRGEIAQAYRSKSLKKLWDAQIKANQIGDIVKDMPCI